MTQSIQRYVFKIALGAALIVTWLLMLLPQEDALQLKNWQDATPYLDKLISKTDQALLKEAEITSLYVTPSSSGQSWTLCVTSNNFDFKEVNAKCIQSQSVGIKLSINDDHGIGVYATFNERHEIEALLFESLIDVSDPKDLRDWMNTIVRAILNAQDINGDTPGNLKT